MSKDKIEVNMNVYDIPILVEELEKANKEIERLNMVIKAIRNYCLINELYSTNETIKEIINQKANSEWLKRLAS